MVSRSGGNPAARPPGHTPAFLCRSLGIRVPFRPAKGDGGDGLREGDGGVNAFAFAGLVLGSYPDVVGATGL